MKTHRYTEDSTPSEDPKKGPRKTLAKNAKNVMFYHLRGVRAPRTSTDFQPYLIYEDIRVLGSISKASGGEFEWVFEKQLAFNVSFFVCGWGQGSDGGVVVDGSSGVLMRCVWRSLDMGVYECVGVEWGVFGGVGEWVDGWVSDFSDKWHSLNANTDYKHESSGVLNSVWPKSGLSEFWKNTLQLLQTKAYLE